MAVVGGLASGRGLNHDHQRPQGSFEPAPASQGIAIPVDVARGPMRMIQKLPE